VGGILAAADYLSRTRLAEGGPPISGRDVLTAMIKAYEIQGILALENSLNRVGLDHVLFLKVASTAVITDLLGGSKDDIINAVSNAWIDNAPLRTYRHAPNTGPRKAWAAGDATSRAVRLALMALKGEMGYPTALTARTWGFSDVVFDGKPLRVPRPFDSYVIENILVTYLPIEWGGFYAVAHVGSVRTICLFPNARILIAALTSRSSSGRVVTVRLNILRHQVSLNPPPNRTYTFPHIRLSEFS